MDPEAWNRLQSLFVASLELPADQREAYLDEACAGDLALRREVEAVLAGHERAGGHSPELSPSPRASLASRKTGEDSADLGGYAGRRIGPYRLEECVGRGGWVRSTGPSAWTTCTANRSLSSSCGRICPRTRWRGVFGSNGRFWHGCSISYSYHNLGRVLRMLGRVDEALDAYQKGLDVRERALGPDHPAVAFILHSYAIALGDAREFARAATLEERAIRIAETALGETDLTTLDSMEFLAQLYALLGRDEEALALLGELVARGWGNLTAMEGEPFAGIAADPRFQRLLGQVRGAAPTGP